MTDSPASAKKSSRTIIIGLSGPSSSGKTTLARLLRSIIEDGKRVRTFIIHEDDFYHPDDKYETTPKKYKKGEGEMLMRVDEPVRIPVIKTARGELVQDWDTAGAIDIDFLASALVYVRENGRLPPRLQSKEDQNEATNPGVEEARIQEVSRSVRERIAKEYSKPVATEEEEGEVPLTIAFLEGFLLYAPPATEDASHILRSVHDNIDLHLFLPAPYDIVKARREARSGYVTIGPAPTPTVERPAHIGHSSVNLDEKDESAPQNFWTDPPGYVDDIVWPRYVQDHAWLLVPEGEGEDGSKQLSLAATTSGTRDESELLKLAGQGVNVRTDAGVLIAPGKGRKPMTEVLDWAVDEILGFLKV